MKFYLPVLLVLVLFGCSMSEEMRRIEETREAEQRREASHSTNLTGEQIFVRSCNTCHPAGKAGLGPSLEQLADHYPDDDALKTFLRKGKGIMPGQPKNVLNDEELDNLVSYLRTLQ